MIIKFEQWSYLLFEQQSGVEFFSNISVMARYNRCFTLYVLYVRWYYDCIGSYILDMYIYIYWQLLILLVYVTLESQHSDIGTTDWSLQSFKLNYELLILTLNIIKVMIFYDQNSTLKQSLDNIYNYNFVTFVVTLGSAPIDSRALTISLFLLLTAMWRGALYPYCEW